MAYSGKVTTSLNVRNGAGTSNAIVKTLAYGDTVTISETKDVAGAIWGKIDDGWICLTSAGGTKYVQYSEVSGESASGNPLFKKLDTANDTKLPYAKEAYISTFKTLLEGDTNRGYAFKKSMRLYGIPYQFRPEVDVRVDKVSKVIGRKFINNIMSNAPVVSIIPGVPKYLPNAKNRNDMVAKSQAFMSAATGAFEDLQNVLTAQEREGESPQRYYDFQQDYTNYMQYVNIMCRTAATFLELTDTLDGDSLQSYDWRNYRWGADSNKGAASWAIKQGGKMVKGVINAISEGGEAFVNALSGNKSSGNSKNKYKHTTTTNTQEQDSLVDSLLSKSGFIQFYCDPDMGATESASNSTQDSMMKGIFDNVSQGMKELAFLMNSGGLSSVDNGTGSFTTSLQEGLSGAVDKIGSLIPGNTGITDMLKRILDVSSNVVKGENMIIPQIYSGSSYDRRYSLTVHLKSIYGSKLAYYLDVLVPLFHLLALALPKQTSANTYGAPFLIKVFCDGIFTTNLGIVSSISINKNVDPESWTVDGFPSEVDVSLEIVDLYSDLTMSPQTNIEMFLANSSLIDYIGTTCGLNFLEPQITNKMKNYITTIKNAFGDIPENIVSVMNDKVDNLLAPWVSIS
jgi:SH3 domain protein